MMENLILWRKSNIIRSLYIMGTDTEIYNIDFFNPATGEKISFTGSPYDFVKPYQETIYDNGKKIASYKTYNADIEKIVINAKYINKREPDLTKNVVQIQRFKDYGSETKANIYIPIQLLNIKEIDKFYKEWEEGYKDVYRQYIFKSNEYIKVYCYNTNINTFELCDCGLIKRFEGKEKTPEYEALQELAKTLECEKIISYESVSDVKKIFYYMKQFKNKYPKFFEELMK